MRRTFMMIPLIATACLTVLLGGGCGLWPLQTPSAVRAYSEEEIAAIFKKGRDPRTFFLSVYQRENETPVFVDAFRTHYGQSAATLFQSPPSTHIPVLACSYGIAGKSFHALLDTSSKDSWTGMDQWKERKLVPLGPDVYRVTPTHVADPVAGYLFVAPTVVIEQMHIETALLFARAARGNIWPLNRDARVRDVSVVFGCNMLRSFSFVQLDFANRTALFSATIPYEPKEDEALAALPITWLDGALAVDASIDGVNKKMIIDSAGDYEITMEKPPLELIRQVSVGPLVWRQVKAKASRDAGLAQPAIPRLGLLLLSRYRLTLDNRRNILYIEKPDEAKTPWWTF